jgi:hypothetical protein
MKQALLKDDGILSQENTREPIEKAQQVVENATRWWDIKLSKN